jgi:hypothetical protein
MEQHGDSQTPQFILVTPSQQHTRFGLRFIMDNSKIADKLDALAQTPSQVAQKLRAGKLSL